MSDPIHSWVDPSELRRIGELLMAEPEEVSPLVAEETVYGVDFEGFGKEQPNISVLAGEAPPTAVNHLAEAKRLAEAGGMLSRSRADQIVSNQNPTHDQVSGRGPFLERMAAFAKWLREEVLVERFFLLDHAGEVLIDELGNADFLASAYDLGKSWQAVARSETRAVGMSLGMQAESGKMIEVIPVDTHYGFMVLGLLISSRITPESAGIVAEGLQSAVMPPEAP